MRIHIYNPEHDYALASGTPFYTPPAEVCRLRDAHALMPLAWADAGDAIIIPETVDKSCLPDTPGVTLLHPGEIAGFIALHPEAEIEPWGWDCMIRHQLSICGVPESKLPSPEWINAVRNISHRRTSILFNEILNRKLSDFGLDRHLSPIPVEFHDAESALEWLKEVKEAFFKAPWSSAGRGVLCSLELDAEKHIEPWLRGIIRRQGSIIGEALFRKKIDFATEWFVGEDADGEPDIMYLGLSSFCASRRGKYHCQTSVASKLERLRMESEVPDFGDSFIEAQREALREVLMTVPKGNRYIGFLGIDMMASENGRIRGGVELNFRRTMGIPPLDLLIVGTGNVATHLFKAFKEAGMRVGIVSGHSTVFPPADVYVIAVKDRAVVETASRLHKSAIEGSFILHTSGSVSIETLKSAFGDGTRFCGVLYPLQTFSAGVEMNYKEIPFLVEGSNQSATMEIINLAKRISTNVREADSEERALYHVAAVLTCNFSIHLCSLADKFLKDKGLDFCMLLPLLKQTITKLETTSPADALTGPAARGDDSVIASHLERLREYPETARIYEILTDSIRGSRAEHASRPNNT